MRARRERCLFRRLGRRLYRQHARRRRLVAPSRPPAIGRTIMISRRVFMSMTAAAIRRAAGWLRRSSRPASGKVALYANVGADLTHYDVDVDGMTLTPRETRQAAGQRAICLAARLAPLSLCREQQHRARLHHRRHRASRHRLRDRPEDRRAEKARRADPPAGAADPYEHRHPVGEHSGRVQQPEFGAGLPHQQGFHPRRGGDAARSDRRRHLCPSDARVAGQPARDPGDARQRGHAGQAGRPRRAEGLRLQGRRAVERSLGRAERRQGISGRAISISIRPSRGSMSRSRRRTR